MFKCVVLALSSSSLKKNKKKKRNQALDFTLKQEPIYPKEKERKEKKNTAVLPGLNTLA